MSCESESVSHSVVLDSSTPWTIPHQAPLSIEFSRQECWSGLPFPSPGDLPNPGIEPASPALQADSIPSEPPGKPLSAGHMEAILLFSSVQISHSVMSNSLWPHGLQHVRLSCPSPTPGAYSNSYPSHRWCHPTISSSVIAFFSCLQSFPASELLVMSRFIASGGQSIRVSASAWVLPMNVQDWFPLGLTGWISLRSKGLSRVFSNTTVQKH